MPIRMRYKNLFYYILNIQQKICVRDGCVLENLIQILGIGFVLVLVVKFLIVIFINDISFIIQDSKPYRMVLELATVAIASNVELGQYTWSHILLQEGEGLQRIIKGTQTNNFIVGFLIIVGRARGGSGFLGRFFGLFVFRDLLLYCLDILIDETNIGWNVISCRNCHS